MQIKKDAGQEKYRTGNNAGQTVTGGIQNREQCRTNRHRRDTEQGTMQDKPSQEGYRSILDWTGGMHWWDAGK